MLMSDLQRSRRDPRSSIFHVFRHEHQPEQQQPFDLNPFPGMSQTDACVHVVQANPRLSRGTILLILLLIATVAAVVALYV
jgi:hypothetical protein